MIISSPVFCLRIRRATYLLFNELLLNHKRFNYFHQFLRLYKILCWTFYSLKWTNFRYSGGLKKNQNLKCNLTVVKARRWNVLTVWLAVQFDDELWGKEDKRCRRIQAMRLLVQQTSRQKALTGESSLQRVKACTQSVFVLASNLHITADRVFILLLLHLLSLWSTSSSFSLSWLLF